MMMRTNRRAEEFDRALTAGSAAKTDPGTAALVALAGALVAVPQRPAPAFRESLRAQLMSEAVKVAAGASAASVGAAASVPAATGLKALPKILARPAMQVATGGLAATIAATGIGVGASRSLPGDPLYGLKRAIERLQDSLAGGTVAKADSVIEHTQTRLGEIAALLDRDGLGALTEVEAALNDIKADLDDTTADLLAQARAGSQAAYDKLDETVRTLTAELTALRSTLPPEAQQELDAAMATLNAAAAQLAALPRPTTPTPTTKTPTPTPTTPTSTSPTSTPKETPSTTPSSEETPTLPTISETPTLPTTNPTLPTLPVTLPPLVP